MNLYVVRHAEAVQVGQNKPSAGGAITRDADRPLSLRGEQDAALMGKALARLDPFIDVVVTSPLLRAVQTGEIIGREISNHATFQTSASLSPGFRPDVLLEELLAIVGGASIISVGHQPDLSMFISYLIADSSRAAVAMEPCAIAHLKLTPRAGRVEAQLRWLLTPDTVRSVHPKF
jgi:phosphohistidine phosphatase